MFFRYILWCQLLYIITEKIRMFNLVHGDGVKKITEEEQKIAEKLRYW